MEKFVLEFSVCEEQRQGQKWCGSGIVDFCKALYCTVEKHFNGN